MALTKILYSLAKQQSAMAVAFHFINLKKSPVAGFFTRSNE
jgi:hypothetical protein